MNDRFRNQLKAQIMRAKLYAMVILEGSNTPLFIPKSEIDIWKEKYGDKLKILVD